MGFPSALGLAAHAGDSARLGEMVSQLEGAWNAGDGQAFAAPFREDADFVDIRGMHHVGRAGIAVGHAHILSTIYRGSHVRYRVEKLRFLSSEAALVFLHAELALADGSSLGARPTLVTAKHSGVWQIVALQNTPINAPEAKRLVESGGSVFETDLRG